MPENWRIPSYYDQLSTEDLLALQAIEGGDQSIATEDLQALMARIKEAEQQSQPIPSPFDSLRSFADPPPLPQSFVEREDPEPGLYDPRGKDRWAIHDLIRDAPVIGSVVKGLAESAHLAQIGKLEAMPGVPDLGRREQLMQERDVPEEDPTIPGTFGRALGTTLPYIGLGMAAVPIAAGLVFLSVPTAIAATIAGGTAFAAMTLYGMAAASGESAERAIDAGATEEEIQRAAQWGLGVGASEAFPPVRIIRRAARVLGPVAKEVGEELSNTVAARLSRIAGGKIRRVGQAAIEEAIQEAAAEVGQNLIARTIYDPEQGIWTGTGESAGYGGGVGGVIAALTEFVLPGMARRRRLSRTQRDREDDAAATEFFNAAQEEREVAASDTDLLGRVVDSMTLTESDLSELNLKLDKATAQNLLNLDLRDPVQLAEARKILSRYRNNPIVQESNPRAVNNIDALLKSDLFAGVWEGDGRRGLPRDVEPSRLYDVDELAGATQEEPITEQPDLIDIAETEQIEEMVDADETQQIEAMLAEDEGIQTAQEIATDRLRQESELESVQRRVEGGQEEQSIRRRNAILQPILANEDLTVDDSIEAFSAALEERGITNSTPTLSEIDLINRAANVKEALATDKTDRAEAAAAGTAPLEALIPEKIDVPITPPSEPTEVVVEDEVVTTPETAATEVDAARLEVNRLGDDIKALEERRKQVHPQARVTNARIRHKTELYKQAQRKLWAAEEAVREKTAVELTPTELDAIIERLDEEIRVLDQRYNATTNADRGREYFRRMRDKILTRDEMRVRLYGAEEAEQRGKEATEVTRTRQMVRAAGRDWGRREAAERRNFREQMFRAGRKWEQEELDKALANIPNDPLVAEEAKQQGFAELGRMLNEWRVSNLMEPLGTDDLITWFHGTGNRRKILEEGFKLREFQEDPAADGRAQLTEVDDPVFWFTVAEPVAQTYRSERPTTEAPDSGVMDVYLRAQSPLILDAEGKNWNELTMGDLMDAADNPAVLLEALQSLRNRGIVTPLTSMEEWDQDTDPKTQSLIDITEDDMYSDNFRSWTFDTTRIVANIAREMGYDSVIFNDMRDRGWSDPDSAYVNESGQTVFPTGPALEESGATTVVAMFRPPRGRSRSSREAARLPVADRIRNTKAIPETIVTPELEPDIPLPVYINRTEKNVEKLLAAYDATITDSNKYDAEKAAAFYLKSEEELKGLAEQEFIEREESQIYDEYMDAIERRRIVKERFNLSEADKIDLAFRSMAFDSAPSPASALKLKDINRKGNSALEWARNSFPEAATTLDAYVEEYTAQEEQVAATSTEGEKVERGVLHPTWVDWGKTGESLRGFWRTEVDIPMRAAGKAWSEFFRAAREIKVENTSNGLTQDAVNVQQAAELAETAPEPKYLYHVTFTEDVPTIKAEGLRFTNKSNWEKGRSGLQYSKEGNIFAFDNPLDAIAWAQKMEWEQGTTDASNTRQMADISIVRLDMQEGEKIWGPDPSEDIRMTLPSRVVGEEGQALRSTTPIEAGQIIDSFKLSEFGPRKERSNQNWKEQARRKLEKGKEAPATTQEREEITPEGITVEEKAEAIGAVTTEEEELKADELPEDRQLTILEQEELRAKQEAARLKALEKDIAAYVPNRKKASKDTVVEITQSGPLYRVVTTTEEGEVSTVTIAPKMGKPNTLERVRALLEKKGFLPKPEPIYTKETEEYLIADAVAASMPLTSDAVNDLALDGDTVGTYEQLGKDTPNRQVRRTINTLIKGLKGTNTKIVFMDELYDRKGRLAAASYDPNTNTIKLNINLPLSSHSLLHEGAHAVTHHIIKKRSHPTTKKLIRLYEDIKDKIPNAYASESLSEFIVEAFQNPEFQSILAGYKPSGRKRTGWDIFVDALYRLFGIDTGITSTADKAARRYINTLLGTEPNTRNATDVNQAIVNDEYKEATEALMGGGQGFISDKTFKDSARSMWISMRGVGQRRMVDLLGALDLEANVEIAKKHLPSAQHVYDVIYKTDGLRNELMKPFHEVLTDSRKAFKGAGDVIVDSDALAIFNNLWIIATTNEVDPTTKDSTSYTKYWLRYGTKNARSKKINRVQRSFNTEEEMKQEKTILETQRDADRKAGKPFIVGKISVTNPDPQRLQAHRTAQELFKKLNSKQRGVYIRLRDSNIEINDKIIEAEDNNVDQFDIGEDIKASLREIMFQTRLEMGEIEPYFALYREGEYWLEFEYTGMDGQKHWSTGSFEKDGDRDYAMKKLREMDFVNKPSVQIRDIDEVRLNIDAHAMPFPFLSALLDRVKRLPGTAEEKADLTTFVQDIVLRALPHQSIVQSRRARRNFPFFEQDAIYAYSKRMPQLITAYAGLATRVEMDIAALQLMKESKVARVQHPDDAEFIKEIAIALAGTRQQTKNRFFGIASYVEFNKNPYLSEEARMVRAGTFIATLGANVSSIAVNVSIMPLVLQARLSGQYGALAALRATALASKLYAQSYGMVERDGIYDVDEEGNRLSDEKLRHFGGWSITNDFSKRPKAQAQYALFDPLKERFRQYGFDTRTISQETSDFQNPTSPFMNNFTYWSAFLFNHSERGIRQVSSIAAYTLEMQKLTGKKWKNMTEEDTAKYGEQAAQTATDIMLWVNASPLLTAGSRISQTNLGSVATQFKKVPLRMLYTHMRMADTLYNDAIGTARTEAEVEEARVLRNTFLWLTVSGGTLVGVKGIPFMGMVIGLWNLFRKEDEDDASTIIAKVTGQGFAYGAINHIIGVDLTDRINLTNLMIRDRGNYRPRTWDRVAEIAGGPSLGVAMRVVRGMFGRDYGYFRGAATPALKRRALEDAIPFAAVSNFLKALRFKDEGYTTRSGYTIISELSDWDITMQMLGFAPYSTRKARDMRARNNRVLMGINNRKSRLFERLWYAHDEELDEMKEEVLEEIRLFNADHPTHAIDSRAAKRSLRTRSKNEMISLLTGGTLVPEAAVAEMILSNKEFMGL